MPAYEEDDGTATAASAARLHWDLFCRVVDNFGDLGVCRRLALHLAALGQCVRLWVDDAALMLRMAPEIPRAQAECWRVGAAGVAWVHWTDDGDHGLEPGDVVVEAFGCDPPRGFVALMANRADRGAPPPVWINLEYLSAEHYVLRSHGLPSPQFSGPGRGLTKWFFYPGFTADTGGLLRERDLLKRRAAFDRHAWLQAWGLPADGEHLVSVFAYEQAPLEHLLNTWADEAGAARVRLMMTAGPLQARARQWLRDRPAAAQRLRITELPWLSSQDFDHLLWACDLNFVRGEDSLVRALWAGSPFVWQIYPQHDGAHAAKLQAFWGWLQAHAMNAEVSGPADQPSESARALHPWWLAWNRLIPWPSGEPWPWEALTPWGHAVTQARTALSRQPPLARALLDFVARRGPPG